MNGHQDGNNRSEIEAARERLERFAKPASQCRNYHDPDRFERHRQEKPTAPHGVSWAELGQKPWRLW